MTEYRGSDPNTIAWWLERNREGAQPSAAEARAEEAQKRLLAATPEESLASNVCYSCDRTLIYPRSAISVACPYCDAEHWVEHCPGCEVGVFFEAGKPQIACQGCKANIPVPRAVSGETLTIKSAWRSSVSPKDLWSTTTEPSHISKWLSTPWRVRYDAEFRPRVDEGARMTFPLGTPGTEGTVVVATHDITERVLALKAFTPSAALEIEAHISPRDRGSRLEVTIRRALGSTAQQQHDAVDDLYWAGRMADLLGDRVIDRAERPRGFWFWASLPVVLLLSLISWIAGPTETVSQAQRRRSETPPIHRDGIGRSRDYDLYPRGPRDRSHRDPS